jgi:predicted RNA-binding Zn ribbon-like protein
MAFDADQLEALAECVELINTGRATSAAGREAGDGLASLAALAAFARRHRVENTGAARPADLPRLRALRARLDAAAAACERGADAAAITLLNELLAETGAVPQIVSHDGRPPHLHVSRASAPLADRIAAHSAMGLAGLVVAGAARRVRVCASARCDAVFIDLTRNQSGRFCDSRTCGNRAHVAAYRSRQLAAAGSG